MVIGDLPVTFQLIEMNVRGVSGTPGTFSCYHMVRRSYGILSIKDAFHMVFEARFPMVTVVLACLQLRAERKLELILTAYACPRQEYNIILRNQLDGQLMCLKTCQIIVCSGRA